MPTERFEQAEREALQSTTVSGAQTMPPSIMEHCLDQLKEQLRYANEIREQLVGLIGQAHAPSFENIKQQEQAEKNQVVPPEDTDRPQLVVQAGNLDVLQRMIVELDQSNMRSRGYLETLRTLI